MPDQFAAFKAQYLQSCTVAGTACDQTFNYWSGYLWFGVAAAALAAFAVTGLSARLGTLAERRTQRSWLQALIFSAGVVAVCLLVRGGQQAWNFSRQLENPACGARIRELDGSMGCLGGRRTVLDALFDRIGDELWLILPATVVVWIAMTVLRRMPSRLWLFPALCLTAYVTATALFGYGEVSSDPLAADNRIAQVVAPMMREQGWPMARVQGATMNFSRYADPARVVGLGPWQRIQFGFGYAHGFRTYARSSVSNGYHTPEPSSAAIRAIAGHELAHIKRRHPELLFAAQLLLVLVLCWLVTRIVARSRFGSKVWTALPLHAAGLIVAIPLLDLAIDGLTLVIEYDADRVGLDISREPDGFAEFALLSAAGSQLELPLAARWAISLHPSNGDRIRMAIAWQERNRPEILVAVPNLKTKLTPANQPYPVAK